MNDHGACASVIKPTSRMSMPVLLSQSGIAIHTNPSGSPDEKESNTTEAVRHERSARDRLLKVEGFSIPKILLWEEIESYNKARNELSTQSRKDANYKKIDPLRCRVFALNLTVDDREARLILVELLKNIFRFGTFIKALCINSRLEGQPFFSLKKRAK